MSVPRKLGLALAVPVLVLAALQLVPYGRNHANPADGAVATFDSRGTEQLAQRACFDCHSNRTRWPWYSAIAPISWRIQAHVDEGRQKLNFTAFDPTSEKMADAAGEAGESVTKGEMPPTDYLLAHPEARLSAAEKQALAAGLDRTFAGMGEGGHGAAPGARAGRVAGREHGEREERGEREEHGRSHDHD